MSRGRVDSHGVLRRLGRVVFGFAIVGFVATLPGVAGAGDDLLKYASVEYASVGASPFGERALGDSELGDQYGTGLEAQTPSVPGTSDDVAVILWDEYQPRGAPASADNGSSAVTLNASQGN